jgi:hypothetical protein
MSIDFSRLLPLGWSNFFSTQIPLEALDRVRPARVVRVERDRYGVDAGEGEFFATSSCSPKNATTLPSMSGAGASACSAGGSGRCWR